MTFGSSSAIFVQAMLNPLLAAAWSTTEPTTYGATGLSADAINCALFNDTTTPDKTAALASTGYNTGVWVTGNEVTGGGSPWVAKGPALASKTFAVGTGTPPTNVVFFDAADAGGAGNVTITNAYGCLIFDDTITAGTVADQGLCFLAFGSAQGVSGGTFTVVFDSTGVFKITV
jgi:hypothetical protein